MMKAQMLLFLLMTTVGIDLSAAQTKPVSPDHRGYVTSQPCVQPVPPSRTGDARPKGSPSAIVLDPKNRDLFNPMTRREVSVLIEVLGPPDKKAGKGRSSSAKDTVSKDLAHERIYVLAQDILAHLAKIHLDEVVAQIKKMPKPDKRALEWGTGMATMIDRCGRGRYEGFGGDPAYLDTLEIVRDNRVILENVVLEKWILEAKMPGMEVPGAGRSGDGDPRGVR